MGFKKTLNNIKSLVTESSQPNSEEAMFRQLGIDNDTIKKLEESSLDMARDKIKIQLRYVNNGDAEDLSYKYLDDSGMDLRANLKNSLILKPSERILVPTGIHFELPESMEIQVRPRSGLAIKNGIKPIIYI